jgi:hypothetical protein
LLIGNLSLEQELEQVQKTKQWIEERADSCEAYKSYLGCWDDWSNPWTAETSET